MDKEYNLIVKLFNGTTKEKIIILKEIEEELKKYQWEEVQEVNLREAKKNEKNKTLRP
jgi:hypothetical protein